MREGRRKAPYQGSGGNSLAVASRQAIVADSGLPTTQGVATQQDVPEAAADQHRQRLCERVSRQRQQPPERAVEVQVKGQRPYAGRRPFRPVPLSGLVSGRKVSSTARTVGRFGRTSGPLIWRCRKSLNGSGWWRVSLVPKLRLQSQPSIATR